MNHFELFHTINLSNFIVNIYCFHQNLSTSSTSDNHHLINKDAIDALTDSLNSQQFPRDIVEILENIKGVTKIEVMDHNNKILLNSEVFL